MNQFQTPILFLVFNRPDTTARVFERIREAKPSQLFVAADGPRPDKPEDIEKCRAVRDIIMKGVDWDCELKTLFREENLGCGKAVSTSIDWFFEYVEQGIILEDDCLPDLSFFFFCQEMLTKYSNDFKVWMVAGTNLIPNKYKYKSSFIFSRLVPIWGWATWKRAWIHNDYEMKTWDQYDKSGFSYFQKQEKNVFEVFSNVKKQNGNDVWDGQWAFTCFSNSGLTIIPTINLIRNIGFGPGATHTHNAESHIQIKSGRLEYPLKYPENKTPEQKFDIAFLNFLNTEPKRTVYTRAKTVAKKIINKITNGRRKN